MLTTWLTSHVNQSAYLMCDIETNKLLQIRENALELENLENSPGRVVPKLQ